MTDASINQKAKVFISYSRDDIGFADQLVAALESFGFDPLIDRQSIPGGEDWKAQLRYMIVGADSIGSGIIVYDFEKILKSGSVAGNELGSIGWEYAHGFFHGLQGRRNNSVRL